jgi:DNA polymerase III epsilon subunit-like protein
VTAWWNGRAVLLDFESDSKEPTDARIITACVAYIKPENPQPALITPMAQTERPIPAEATAIHGITTAWADEWGRPRVDVVAAVATALATGPVGAPVIGHNIRYDLTVLDRELRRTGVGSLGIDGARVTVRVDGRQVGAFHVIDTLTIDKQVDPYRKGRRTLDATAAHYNVPIKGTAHTAEADALAAGRVAWAIAKRCDMDTEPLRALYADRRDPLNIVREFHALGTLTLEQLHRAQIRWAAEQASGLRDYFAKNPDHGDWRTVSNAWPLEPVGTVDAVTDLV